MRLATLAEPPAPTPFSLANEVYCARAARAVDAVCAIYPINRTGLAHDGDTRLAREARAVAVVLLTEDVGLGPVDAASTLMVSEGVLAAARKWLGRYLSMEPATPTEALRQREVRANIARARAGYERADRLARKLALRAHIQRTGDPVAGPDIATPTSGPAARLPAHRSPR